jgi:hypothetical protein
MCLICNQTISVFKGYNIKCQCNIPKEKYHLFVEKIETINCKVNETAVKVSCALSHLIASN